MHILCSGCCADLFSFLSTLPILSPFLLGSFSFQLLKWVLRGPGQSLWPPLSLSWLSFLVEISWHLNNLYWNFRNWVICCLLVFSFIWLFILPVINSIRPWTKHFQSSIVLALASRCRWPVSVYRFFVKVLNSTREGKACVGLVSQPPVLSPWQKCPVHFPLDLELFISAVLQGDAASCLELLPEMKHILSLT